MGRFIFPKGGVGDDVPEREVHCSKSARICKAKIILIRQNYFASNINSGSRCTNSDNNAQCGSIPKQGQGPTFLPMGPLSNTANDYKSPVSPEAEVTRYYWIVPIDLEE